MVFLDFIGRASISSGKGEENIFRLQRSRPVLSFHGFSFTTSINPGNSKWVLVNSPIGKLPPDLFPSLQPPMVRRFMTHIVADAVRESLERSSWIRKMFEEGARLKAEHGVENVCDFSLGNPILDPPPEVNQALRSLLENPVPGMHRYIPNAGLEEVRAYLAGEISAATGLEYGAHHIVITCGAAGAVNTALKALLNPGDEVVTFSPYFVEYDFYVGNHGGKLARARTDGDFQIDLETLAAPTAA